MSVSSLILAGGALVTAAGPSSAATGSTNVCSSFVVMRNFSTSVATGTLSGCHQQGSATVDVQENTQNYFAPFPVTIHWATGHATSRAIAQRTAISLAGPCPAGDVTETGTTTVIDGPYAGSVGHNVLCDDLSHFPIIRDTNLGPFVI
jgi:hypothetical protein